jgi:hypothetical protein
MIFDAQTIAPAGHSDVLAALRAASTKTGLDFDYLLHTAMRESSLNVQAKSKTSSATGLFQFVDQTWLGLVKRFGERYGLGSYAASIQQGADGHFGVASPQTKSAILALRQDPELSALMAGEGAKQTKQSLECALGREVCGGELYAAHFFGPSGARHLIELKERNPDGRADLAFPQAAKANKSAFYHPDGTAKTVGEVYAWAVDAPTNSTPSVPATAPSSPQASGVDSNVANLGMSSDVSPLTTTDRTTIASQSDADDNVVSAYRGRATVLWSNSNMSSPQPSTAPQSPVLLSPGIVEILARLSPLPIRRAA